MFKRKIIKENKLNINFVKPFEVLMLGWGSEINNNLFIFYKTIKDSNRNKIYIGPDRLKGIVDYLNIDKFIEIPLINAYDNIDEIFNEVKSYLTDNSILLYSVGLMSPVLICKILEINNNTINLDVGSGFDPLFFKRTRGRKQVDTETSKKYFKPLLNENN